MNKAETTEAGGDAASASPEDNVGFALDAYRRIHFIRTFETRCFELGSQSPPVIAGSIHLCAGQEAVPVAAAEVLDDRDAVVATYRGHGWALEFGVTAEELLAEICQKATGINGGRAGSPLVMAPGRGFIGENSIVGAGVPIASGIALAEQYRRTGGVAVVSFGDGATSQGALHEGIVFAVSRKLPLVLVLEHNAWSEMTPTSRIVPLDRLARRAAGYGIPGVTIDGSDPMAVRQTLQMAVDRARQGEGPCLVECRVPRLWGHYNRDVEHYRPKEDRAEAERCDPLLLLEQRLISQAGATEEDLERIRAENERSLAEVVDRVLAAPAPNPRTARMHVTDTPSASGAPDDVSAEVRGLSYIQAVNEALRAELASRPEVVVYGEDCGSSGGIFAATRYLQREFGSDRVFDTPIAESAILGSAVGAAMRGLRPIVEIMWADFLLVALDQLVNQAANVRYVTSGACNVPMVVRMQQGATPGSCAQHSQCLEALLFHIPGLKLGLPATPQDAYDMLRAAVADPDPTVIIEARALYQSKSDVRLGGAVETVGGARWHRRGSDVTILAWSTAVGIALEAADALAGEGIETGVLDLRWLAPLDDEALADAVAAGSGRIVVVHEANVTGGVGAEIAARLAERHGSQLRHPVLRVGALDTRVPSSPVLQAAVLPTVERVVGVVRSMFGI